MIDYNKVINNNFLTTKNIYILPQKELKRCYSQLKKKLK